MVFPPIVEIHFLLKLILVHGIHLMFFDVIVAVVFVLPEGDQIGGVGYSKPLVCVELLPILRTVPHLIFYLYNGFNFEGGPDGQYT